MNTATHDATAIAQHYIAVWNETDTERRAALIEAGWTADARYVDPLAQAIGREQISALVGVVHQRYPGVRFNLLGKAGLLDGRWNGQGRGLAFYLPTGGPDDLKNARRTVNITDHWEEIADFYQQFMAAIAAARA